LILLFVPKPKTVSPIIGLTIDSDYASVLRHSSFDARKTWNVVTGLNKWESQQQGYILQLRNQSRSEIKHCTFVTQGERHNYDPRLSIDPVCTISPSTRYRKIAL